MSETPAPQAARELTRARRAGARLAAVQALFQMEQTGQGVNAAVRDFLNDRLGLGDEGQPVEEADPDMFKGIVEGVVEHQSKLDQAISARLAAGWRLDRIDSTTRSILRAASYELAERWDLAPAIVVDAYVGIASAFFEEGDETRFVNGVLDKLAIDLRKGDAARA